MLTNINSDIVINKKRVKFSILQAVLNSFYRNSFCCNSFYWNSFWWNSFWNNFCWNSFCYFYNFIRFSYWIFNNTFKLFTISTSICTRIPSIIFFVHIMFSRICALTSAFIVIPLLSCIFYHQILHLHSHDMCLDYVFWFVYSCYHIKNT